MPLLIHGDAAFAGRGSGGRGNPQPQRASRLPSVGGTMHIIVNNQIGFTTSPDPRRRSTPVRHGHRAHARRSPSSTSTARTRSAVAQVVDQSPCRVAPAVPPRRGHRHVLLPQARPQRRRRAGVHPAAQMYEAIRIDGRRRAQVYRESISCASGTLSQRGVPTRSMSTAARLEALLETGTARLASIRRLLHRGCNAAFKSALESSCWTCPDRRAAIDDPVDTTVPRPNEPRELLMRDGEHR